jgi:outer membrane lipoprotein carrier protein
VVVGMADDPDAALDSLLAVPGVHDVLHRAERRAFIAYRRAEVEVRITAPAEPGTALFESTGSPVRVHAVGSLRSNSGPCALRRGDLRGRGSAVHRSPSSPANDREADELVSRGRQPETRAADPAGRVIPWEGQPAQLQMPMVSQPPVVPRLAVALVFCAWPALGQTRDSAATVAAALQQKYEGVATFSADFTHEHVSGVLKRKRVEQGSLVVKKPGRMRWEYKSPEKKLFVSDGTQIYFYDLVGNQVTVSPMPRDDEAASAALFLLGRGNLTRDFSASFEDGGGDEDTYVLRLVPKREQADYDWLEMTVDRRTLQLLALSAADKQGGRTTFLFSNFKENVRVADKTFEFKIPPGADVNYVGRAKR